MCFNLQITTGTNTQMCPNRSFKRKTQHIRITIQQNLQNLFDKQKNHMRITIHPKSPTCVRKQCHTNKHTTHANNNGNTNKHTTHK